MAEAIGLVASCLSILKTIETLNTIIASNIRTKAAAKKELVPILGKLKAYKGLIEGIKLEAELDEGDHGRLSALLHVDGPLHSCELALKTISNRLEHLPRHIVLGKPLDGTTIKALKTLDESRQILNLALDADQRTITKSVEQYVVNITEDLRDFRDETRKYFQTFGYHLVELRAGNNVSTDCKQSAAEAERDRIRRWLTPCDPSRIYEQSIQIPHSGSGKWFMDHLFCRWIAAASSDAQTSIMWLRGRSGLGKTVLTSIALHRAKIMASTGSGFTLAYFYCSFADKASQDPINIIGSLIAQVCDQAPHLWSNADNLYATVLSDAQRYGKRPTLRELVSLLQDCCRSTPSVLMMLDAPNESEQSHELMAALRTVCGREVGLQLFISSTEDINESTLDTTFVKAMCVCMDTDTNNHDISHFIDAQLRDQPQLSRLPQSLKAEVKDALLTQAQGSFRWAQCQLESLAEQARSPASIQSALKVVSPGLDKLYGDALLAVPQSDRRYVRAALLWLAYAWRPIRLAELSEAMVLEDEATVFDKQTRLLFPLEVLRPCYMLISFNASNGRVMLAHSSVQEYITSHGVPFGGLNDVYLGCKVPHHMIGRLCIRYLSLPSFEGSYCLSDKEKSDRKADWPLLEYASGWPFHVRVTPNALECGECHTFEILWKFLKTSESVRGGNFGAWIQFYLPRHIRFGTLSTPLYYAAREGLDHLVKSILQAEGKGNLEVPGGSRGSTPLHVASAYGRLEVVRTLLAAGANPHEKNQYGDRGIEFAANYSHSQIVQALLDAGADESRRVDVGNDDAEVEVEDDHSNEEEEEEEEEEDYHSNDESKNCFSSIGVADLLNIYSG